VNELIDELVGLLEPDPSDRPTLDSSCAPPIEYQPNTVYAFPSGQEQHIPFGPPCEQVYFEVTVLYIADDEGELDEKVRDRAVSDLMADKAAAWMAVLNANRSKGPNGETRPWNHLTGAVDYDRIHALQARGVAIIVSGYYFVGP
jgi:hypothetical protein